MDKKVVGRLIMVLFAMLVVAIVFYDQISNRVVLRSEGPTAVVQTNLYLKAGPGELFDRLGTVAKWSAVAIQAKAPGAGWYYVMTSRGETGWMAASYLKVTGDVNSLPTQTISDTLVVTASIRLDDGSPVDGVVLGMYPAASQDGSDTVTGVQLPPSQAGYSYAFLPAGTGGEWVVGMGGVNCDSPLMEPDCKMGPYFVSPLTQTISLAESPVVTVTFFAATTKLSGVIQDQEGKPVSGVLVFGTRADGANSAVPAGSDGTFSLPLGPGTWQVRAQDQGLHGEWVTVTVLEGQDPQPVTLVMP